MPCQSLEQRGVKRGVEEEDEEEERSGWMEPLTRGRVEEPRSHSLT